MTGLSVIVPSKTASNLVPCLEAVRRQEDRARLIIVDDGLDLTQANKTSTDGCWLCDMDPALRIRGQKPFVFGRNCNLGIAAAGEDDVILLNDDALLGTEHGFASMQRVAEEHPEYGVIAATTNIAGNTSQYPQGRSGLRDEQRTVAFVCVLIPRGTIERVGLLDERFAAYGWDDNDYCRRVRNAGLRIGIFDGCYVDHGSLRSTFRGDPRAAGNIHGGAEIYRSKWGDLN